MFVGEHTDDFVNRSSVLMNEDAISVEWTDGDGDTVALSSGKCSPVETLVEDSNRIQLDELNTMLARSSRYVQATPEPSRSHPPPLTAFPSSDQLPPTVLPPYVASLETHHRRRRETLKNEIFRDWTSILRPRLSKSRANRVPPHNIQPPAPVHHRSSLASTISCASDANTLAMKAIPSKSCMLSRSASLSTKSSVPKCVKFVDVPTVHEVEYDGEIFNTFSPPMPPPSQPHLHSGSADKSRRLSRILLYLKSTTTTPKSEISQIDQRLKISGPYRLSTGMGDRGSTSSLRSAKPSRKTRSACRKLRIVLGRVTCFLP